MGRTTRLPASFYDVVHADVRSRLAADGLAAGLFDDPDDVAYLTGFFHFPNERPVAVWVPVAEDEDVVLLVPALEREYAEHQAARARFVDYPEYPGLRPPFSVLAAEVPAPRGTIGHAGATTVARRAAMADAFPGVPLQWTTVVDAARAVKYDEEVELHREAGRMTDLMLDAGRELVLDRLRSGAELPTEAELAGYVTGVGTAAMYAQHDDVVVVPHLAGGLVYSGPNSARPHALPSGRRLRRGEPFMLSLGAGVGGRHVEGERTFLVGEPDGDQQRYYSTVLAAQETGLAAMRSGRTCAEVNQECLAVVHDAGLGGYLRHRQGHGIGLNIHEPPWLEDGDLSVLADDMIMSDEPGIYVPGHGGYRVSDSVLVGPTGGEPLTHHPKRLDDIVLSA